MTVVFWSQVSGLWKLSLHSNKIKKLNRLKINISSGICRVMRTYDKPWPSTLGRKSGKFWNSCLTREDSLAERALRLSAGGVGKRTIIDKFPEVQCE